MKLHLTILTGASRGMGLALAQQLLSPQASLLCISRHANAALTTQAADCGARLEQWPRDLADSQPVGVQLIQWLRALEPQHLASATLINNAGMLPALAPLRESPAAELTAALRVGLEAPLLLCHAFLNATQHWTVPRKVLNISSGLGRRAMASQSAYCAAKAGMDHFTRCLALDEARQPHGARVCALAPGVVDTDMQMQLRQSDPQHFPDQSSFDALHQQGQLTSPSDAAQRVLAYLARPDFGDLPVADVRS